MWSDTAHDLSSLARLAQNPHGELWPLLLRVQTQLFVSSPHRDGAASASYETLALGLIPLVPDDVLVDVSALLRDVAEAPTAIMTALTSRLRREAEAAPTADAELCSAPGPAGRPDLGRDEIRGLADQADGDVDLALALNRAIVLDGRALAVLVERASTSPGLAAALLRRPEMSVFDRAALYRFADREARDEIRTELSPGLALFPAARTAPLPPGRRDDVVRAAESGDLQAVFAALASDPNLDPAWRHDLDADAELLVLALRASGVSAPDCIRAVLALGTCVSRSVAAVFRLADIARSTPLAVAAYLTGCGRLAPRSASGPASEPRPSERGRSAQSARGHLAADGRVQPVSAPSPDRAGSGRDTSARAGHRSRSTTGPGRT